ncbi:uncharacterized protein LOC131018646 [Salvia miltiorrhiza]|uniref:uncharacterized protein LOC131018646 n=1 Tax=Salvia miltiorrhiza TaxID=226208 RepID=UPI0025ACB090|nr:uncharacterized protein LOC131018646 [Salvia miltiorrhiza]
MDNKLMSSNWIAKRYLNVFRVRYNLCVADLRADILHRFSTHVAKDRLYKAKRIAQELVRGTVEAHYASIRRYIAELRRADPKGRFELLVDDGGVLKGLYLGFSSLRYGFKRSCRKLIGLDGCFLKTYLGGILLCFSWAVVEIENEECWTWFLKCLIEDVGIEDGNGWTFISDQQKGLENAVPNLAPCADHRNCARHAYMNWKKSHKGATLKNLFWRAARSTYVEEFKLAIQDMKTESPTAFEDFMARDTTRFRKAFLSTSACSDMIDNNITETFNGYILNARGKHVIHMCEEIRNSLMVRQVKKFKEMSNVIDALVPNIRKSLEVTKWCSRNCIPFPALGGKFEVHDEADKFVVDVTNRACTCRIWDLTGIPCKHAISSIQFMKLDPVDYVSDYYIVKRYLEGYQIGLPPVRGEKMWPDVEGFTVKPPTVRKRIGRPKKKRIRAPEEKDGKLTKHGIIMTCSNCQGKGHNSRGCKNQQVQKESPKKRKRGRPAKPKEISTSKNKESSTKLMKSTIHKERAFGKQGLGVFTASSGNVYIRPSTSSMRVTSLNTISNTNASIT